MNEAGASMSPSFQARLQRLEAYVPLALGIHGAILLILFRGGVWQWLAVGVVGGWGVVGITRWRYPSRPLVASALILATGWFLMFTVGGPLSFFFGWYIVLVAIYPLLLRRPYAVLLTGIAAFVIAALAVIMPQDVPQRFAIGQIIVLLVLGTTAHIFGSMIRRYENERDRAENSLRESEARYRAVVEDQTELICRWLPDGTLTFVNDAYCRYFGMMREELLGTNFTPLVPDDDQHIVQKRFSTLKDGNVLATFEHRVITPDSEVRWQQWTDRAFLDRAGSLAEIQSVGRDITEVKLAEQAVFQAHKMKSLGILAGGVAHDFNNMLVSILGQISLAQAKLPVDDPLQPHLAKAMRAAERAADLARQMLAYSGRGHFEVQALDLNRLIEDYMSLLEASLPKNVQLRHALAGPLPSIEADPGQIQQIIMNLLLNAAEAMGEQAGTIIVSTGVRNVHAHDQVQLYAGKQLDLGQYVVLRVQDDGSGMDMEILTRIFDPFFTTKFTGRGLGLAAVLGIVNGHKGGLQVHSQKGSGTVFTLFFPASTAERDLPASVPSSVADPNTEDDNPCVLVIDDEESVRHTVIDILASIGVGVFEAADGHTGIATYRKHTDVIQLVLLDLSMPGLSTEQILHELRKMNLQVRVVLSSGYAEEEVMSRFKDMPVTGFLHKPYKAAALIDKIRRYLM